MASKSQAKGRRAEIELAELLNSHGYNNVHTGRALSFGEQPDIIGLPFIHCEVKRCEQLRLSAWMAKKGDEDETEHR